MTQVFSQTLRDQTKAYFEKRYSLTISDGKADEYLRSFDDLCFALGSRSSVASGETRFPKETYNTVSRDKGKLSLDAIFDTRTFSNEPIFSAVRKYSVDSYTGRHVSGGDREREGYPFDQHRSETPSNDVSEHHFKSGEIQQNRGISED